MQLVHGFQNVPASAKDAVLAIGNFDGVHRGHRALINTAISIAKDRGKEPGVLVFEPHPREFFLPNESHFRLTTLDRKLELFAEFGLSVAFILQFDADLAKMSGEEFIESVLFEGLGVAHVIIGYDFYFGHKRLGNPELMVDVGERLGFGVTVMPPVAESGEAFSSSAVRLHLAQVDIAGANRILGRPWQVHGKVVGGARRGTGLGYPTANVPMPRGTALGHGIYAVRAIVDGEPHDAAGYLGTRPTFDNGKPVLEVYLLDFDGDLYGYDMTVEFVAFIRPDRKFDTPEELVEQMEIDIAAVRRALAEGMPAAG